MISTKGEKVVIDSDDPIVFDIKSSKVEDNELKYRWSSFLEFSLSY